MAVNDNRNDILRWTKLAERMLKEDEAPSKEDLEKERLKEKERLDNDLNKSDAKLMQAKVEKLNNIIKKKYFDGRTQTAEEKQFQFRFEDRGDFYEFSMPLNILFGPKTREYAAKYWEEFFDQADIKTNFDNNIAQALKQAGSIMLTMKINKNLTKEVE